MSSTPQDKRAGSERLKPGSPTEPVPFGKYYLLGLIARGGMAEVYRARPRDVESTQLLAIKVMRPQLAREAAVRRHVQPRGPARDDAQEPMHRRHGRGRSHRGPALHRDGVHRRPRPHPGACVAARRPTSASRSRTRSSSPRASPRASHFAHNLDGLGRPALNIVNRDVSPSNVRLSYDGDVKLLDFGIAQALMKFTSARSACSRASSATCRPSRSAACRSTRAPTSSPPASSSTRC